MQRQASRLTPGGPGGAGHHPHHSHHLQQVQDDEIRCLNLPPSISVSRDGEEGAGVYNLRLQQSNADARPDCYQAPPNRTAGASGGLVVGPRSPPPCAQPPETSTSPPPLPPPLLTRREVAASLARFRSVTAGDDPVDVTDVPGRSGKDSSLSGGGWKPTSPDLSSRLIVIPSPPHSAPSSGAGAGVTGAGATGATGAKRRSSSADSVRRLVARCSLLRFARRHAMTTVAKATTTMTTTSPSTMTLLVDPQQQAAFDNVDSGHSPGGDEREPEAPPWELPPNYVDMIFTKDPATIDENNRKDATKQQQQQRRQQQQEQRQQRQSQHCCFNS